MSLSIVSSLQRPAIEHCWRYRVVRLPGQRFSAEVFWAAASSIKRPAFSFFSQLANNLNYHVKAVTIRIYCLSCLLFGVFFLPERFRYAPEY